MLNPIALRPPLLRCILRSALPHRGETLLHRHAHTARMWSAYAAERCSELPTDRPTAAQRSGFHAPTPRRIRPVCPLESLSHGSLRGPLGTREYRLEARGGGTSGALVRL